MIHKAVLNNNYQMVKELLEKGADKHINFMTKKWELTGKNPMKGHNVSHANNKTKRRFLPNLKKVKFTSEVLKRSLKLTVSNAGVRSVDKKGSFDEFLKTVKNKNISARLKKLKKSLLIKSPYQKKSVQTKTA